VATFKISTPGSTDFGAERFERLMRYGAEYRALIEQDADDLEVESARFRLAMAAVDLGRLLENGSIDLFLEERA
jgi:hypothetical protein